ncbi:hypothetical protein [Nostoc sp. DedQUE12b]|nr:hypothetical protein [Nostoc sp. DedQUE12b]
MYAHFNVKKTIGSDRIFLAIRAVTRLSETVNAEVVGVEFNFSDIL